MDLNYRFYEQQGFGIFEFLHDKLINDDSSETIETIKSLITKKHVQNFILDLTKVTVIDSVGIGYLIAIKNAAGKKGIIIHLVSDNTFVLKVFSITRVDTFFRIFRNLADALASV
ncbi:MAG: STAS domain-containing protein [Spirochaetes bacterium]|nr:STAS domain-containing protein [Spirochaetota bacterium]